MPAILFFAPKAGEARRKEASRKGTNGRKERRKEGSQEGRKKDALSVNIVYIKFHQVPNRPPFGTGTVFATYLSVPRMGNVKRAQNGHHYTH